MIKVNKTIIDNINYFATLYIYSTYFARDCANKMLLFINSINIIYIIFYYYINIQSRVHNVLCCIYTNLLKFPKSNYAQNKTLAAINFRFHLSIKFSLHQCTLHQHCRDQMAENMQQEISILLVIELINLLQHTNTHLQRIYFRCTYIIHTCKQHISQAQQLGNTFSLCNAVSGRANILSINYKCLKKCISL